MAGEVLQVIGQALRSRRPIICAYVTVDDSVGYRSQRCHSAIGCLRLPGPILMLIAAARYNRTVFLDTITFIEGGRQASYITLATSKLTSLS